MTAGDPHENVAAGGSAWVVQARKTVPWTTPFGDGEDEAEDPPLGRGVAVGEAAPLQAARTRTRLAALSAASRRMDAAGSEATRGATSVSADRAAPRRL